MVVASQAQGAPYLKRHTFSVKIKSYSLKPSLQQVKYKNMSVLLSICTKTIFLSSKINFIRKKT